MSNFELVILAGGKGSRMKSNIPKLLNKIRGKTILDRTIQKAKMLKPKKITVIINDELKGITKEYKKINFIQQKKQLGTGHAVKVFYNKNKFIKNDVLIMMGDAPFIKRKDIEQVLKELKNNHIVVLGAKLKNNKSNGVFFIEKNRVKEIREYKFLNKNEKNNMLCNTGVKDIKKRSLKIIRNIKKNLIKKEYLITDIIKYAHNKNLDIKLVKTSQGYNSFGINSLEDLDRFK